MSEPFLWAFEIRDLEVGAGDICPGGVDPDGPFDDPSAMARFPDTDHAPGPGGHERGADRSDPAGRGTTQRPS